MRIASRSDGIGKEHSIQPRVDDAIARSERDASPRTDEIREGMMRHDIHGLGIGRRMTKGLHDEIGTESQTGESTQFIPCHGTGRILGTHRRHGRFTILTGNDTLHTTGLAHHFLGQRESLGCMGGWCSQCKGIGNRSVYAQGGSGLGGQPASNNERNPSTGPYFIQQDGCLEFKFRQDFLGIMFADLAIMGIDINHVTHFETRDIQFNGKGTGILHGIEENGCNLSSKTDPTTLQVGHVGNILSHEPQNRIGGGLS
mmetsp:Transcript_25601/g.59448  ORF Transcript_25601/g.59448 Transcript_25601/m.59448 type:complete len:257 (-) Transcript_25601:212-982(-)